LSGIALRSRRSRAAVATPSANAGRPRQEASEPAPEPRFEPAPSPEQIVEPAPPSTRIEPDVAHSAAVDREPSPEIQSPGLQPGSGVHPSPDNPSR
jgi:hypothetical protein